MDIGRTITFNTIAFSYSEETEIYSLIINGFNNYSKQNNLDIHLNMFHLSIFNSLVRVEDYRSTLDYIFSKDEKRYDIFFYDIIYSKRYGPYLLDLKDLIPEEVKKYDSKFIFPNCYYKNKLVGLPMYLDFSALYYNEELLAKYNQEIPKTWNNLYKSGKYIMEKERENNNLNLITYNGFFPLAENGFCSLYEYLYSYREFVNSTFPNLNSLSIENAFKMMKKIKDDLSSDEIFLKNANFATECLRTNNSLFIKFINAKSTLPIYKKTILPGVKKGISGTTIWGYNIGISKLLSEEEKSKMKYVLSYMCSEDIQKTIIINKKLLSPITSLYEDNEVCKYVDCKLYKSIQPIFRPTAFVEEYDNYSNNFIKYFHEYLSNRKSLNNAIKSIIDITKIYTITIGTKDNIVGLITIILISIILLFIIITFFNLLCKDFLENFIFLPVDYWMLSMLGTVLLLLVCFLDMGNITVIKCHFKQIIISIAHSLTIIPILYKLIIDFPKEVKLFGWIYHNRHYFILMFIVIDILFNLLGVSFHHIK